MKTQEAWQLIASKGECIEGDIHILCMSREPDGNDHYRIYHSSGYCIDLRREYVCEPDEVADQFDPTSIHEDGYHYSWTAEWDGFEKVDNTDHLITLLKQWTK